MDKLTVVIAEDDPKIAEIQNRFIEKIDGFLGFAQLES